MEKKLTRDYLLRPYSWLLICCGRLGENAMEKGKKDHSVIGSSSK
jgi:hypothetical protein